MAHPDFEALYQDFLAAPFPRIGGSLGGFVMYDAFIAGYGSRAVKGEAVSASVLPEPDHETTAFFAQTQASQNRSSDEAEFCGYFVLLERVRQAISNEQVDLQIPLLSEGTDVWVIAKGQRVAPRIYVVDSFETDLEAQDAEPAFAVGALVYVNGGDMQWDGGAVVGATPRVAVREISDVPHERTIS